VAVPGAGSQRTSARSRGVPVSGSVSCAAAARRAFGRRPASAVITSLARGPLIRTTAIAAGAGPLDKAKIVAVMGLAAHPAPALLQSPSRLRPFPPAPDIAAN